ncbi:MAG: UbiA-like polyprenyltransferase [Zavarzinella sp.]
MQTLKQLLSLIRFSHTIFALPFALMSASIAWYREGEFRWWDLAGILCCMVFARSAAMAFNRLVDRKIDADNPRTATRHLPAGTLQVGTVWLFFLLCAALFVLSTFIFSQRTSPNWWPFRLSGIVLVFICAYSVTKRFTYLAHFWLGVSLMLAPIAAWIAIRGLTDLLPPTLIGLAVCFWVAGFDMIYACQDAEFDRKAKLNSIPARFGVATSLRLAAASHLVMLVVLTCAWWVMPELKFIFLSGVIIIALLLIVEHRLVKPNDLTKVNQAFFQVNSIISAGLLAIVLIQLALPY